MGLAGRQIQNRFLDQRVEVRIRECLEAGRQHLIGKQNDRHAETPGDLGGFGHEIKTILDARGREHDTGGIAVAAMKRYQEVGLLDIGGKPGRRTSALHIDDDERQLGHHRVAEGLRLEGKPGPGGRGHRRNSPIGSPERGGDRRQLVLGLEEAPPIARQLPAENLHDLGRRRDGIPRTESDASGNRAKSQRLVSGHRHVGGIGGGLEVKSEKRTEIPDLVGVACLQRQQVVAHNRLVLRPELLLHEIFHLLVIQAVNLRQ